jgi:hypothetical protein
MLLPGVTDSLESYTEMVECAEELDEKAIGYQYRTASSSVNNGIVERGSAGLPFLPA